MLRSVAGFLVVMLVLGSGRLLACDWECGEAVTAPAVVACHDESPDSGAALIGGVAHDCPSEAVEPIVAAIQKAETQGIGAPALGQSIAVASPAIASRIFRPLDRGASVRHPLLIAVLRI